MCPAFVIRSMLSVGLLVGFLAAPACGSASAQSKGLLLVANKGLASLSVVDAASGLQVAAIPEEAVTGHEVAVSLDGTRAFVPIYGNSGVGMAGTDGQLIRVIDLRRRAIVGTIDFGRGLRPHCPVVGPRNGLLYVTTELWNLRYDSRPGNPQDFGLGSHWAAGVPHAGHFKRRPAGVHGERAVGHRIGIGPRCSGAFDRY